MKGKKNATELQAMIMQEVRKHPDWSHILDIAITQSVQIASASRQLERRVHVRWSPHGTGRGIPICKRVGLKIRSGLKGA